MLRKGMLLQVFHFQASPTPSMDTIWPIASCERVRSDSSDFRRVANRNTSIAICELPQPCTCKEAFVAIPQKNIIEINILKAMERYRRTSLVIYITYHCPPIHVNHQVISTGHVLMLSWAYREIRQGVDLPFNQLSLSCFMLPPNARACIVAP